MRALGEGEGWCKLFLSSLPPSLLHFRERKGGRERGREGERERGREGETEGGREEIGKPNLFTKEGGREGGREGKD